MSPQAPVEQGGDRATRLQMACLKAGLPKDAWKDQRTGVLSFTALALEEREAGRPQAKPATPR